jgi:hypothetical protein
MVKSTRPTVVRRPNNVIKDNVRRSRYSFQIFSMTLILLVAIHLSRQITMQQQIAMQQHHNFNNQQQIASS